MNRQRAVLLLVLLVAFFLRVWRLPELPPGLWYDEAYYGMDAAWLARGEEYPVFFVGNNGREPMWLYLLSGAIQMIGQTPFTLRWVAAMAGFVTVAVLYRFALVFLAPFARGRWRRWLAVAAVAWLAVSWWHLQISRVGLRPVLLPPLLMLGLYFFWRGWRRGRRPDFAAAGLFLGLVQYTYLPARLAPLILGGFVLLWSLQGRASLRWLWLGLLVTALIAVVVFAPLGSFFWQYPAEFSARTGDVVISPAHPAELGRHLLSSLGLFLGAGHELYRHHLPGRAMLGWLEIPFFWLGLAALLLTSRRRQPESQLLLLGLGVMWLPALLASPPVHALRPIGLLPFYYLVVALGSGLAAQRLAAVFAPSFGSVPGTAVMPLVAGGALAALIALNGMVNAYDYFWRWAGRPEVYQEYNGPLVDLTRQLIGLTESQDVLVPFHLYVHPTTRYLLGPSFTEVTGPPPALRRPLALLLVPDNFQLLYVGNIPASPAMVLLTRDETGRGYVYVSRPPRSGEQAALDGLLGSLQAQIEPLGDRLGRTVAQLLSLPPAGRQMAAALFDPQPLRIVSLAWGAEEPLVRLVGYEVTPEVVQPGRPVMINLYWRSLTGRPFDNRLFLQLIDGGGKPVNQWEGMAVQEDMYRWRPDGLLPSRHMLWLGPDTPPGPYLIRLGFFEAESRQRLPVRMDKPENEQMGDDDVSGQNGAGEVAVADQVQLGLFYVTVDGQDPRQPAAPLSATFGDVIQLTGVSLPLLTTDNPQFIQSPSLPVTFYWQALRPTAKPYTVFLQLLNEQDEVVASWDSQPYAGLYPTQLWSPGEVIVDTFHLPLPVAGLAPGPYRLITGFYDVNSGQRLPVSSSAGGDDWVELARFSVAAH